MKKALVAVSILFIGIEGWTFASMKAVAAPLESGMILAQATRKPLPPAEASSGRRPISPMGFGLADGTAVKLKFKQTISSKTAQNNEPIEFEVAEDVFIGNALVIARGATAKGMVVEARPSGMLGRKGKLEIAVKEVELVSGERVMLRAKQENGGGNSAGVLAVAAVVNPLFLLLKGKNVTYNAGTEVSAFVDGNFELDRAKFRSR